MSYCELVKGGSATSAEGVVTELEEPYSWPQMLLGNSDVVVSSVLVLIKDAVVF